MHRFDVNGQSRGADDAGVARRGADAGSRDAAPEVSRAVRRAARSICTRTSARPRTSRSAMTSRKLHGHAPRRPHAHGDRVRGHAGARASVHRRRGLLPRAQRLAVESAHACAASSSRSASRSRPTTTPKPRAASSNGACARATTSTTARASRLRGARRLLHVPDGHGRGAGAGARCRSPASRRWWPRPTTTSPSPRNSARSRICRACSNANVFEPQARGDVLMEGVKRSSTSATTPLRELNRFLHREASAQASRA